jgi:sulfur carrier protein
MGAVHRPDGGAAVTVHVNGAAREIPAGSALTDLVALVTSAQSGIAVAVNGEVVPRSSWPDTRLADGDRVEVVTAMQGG